MATIRRRGPDGRDVSSDWRVCEMTFKLQTDYALRTLIYLASVDRQASVREVAAAYGISPDHLFKVVQQLVRFGYLASRPGRKGGIRLAREALLINCGDVVADFEGRNGLLPCVKDSGYCVLDPGCALKAALIAAEDAAYAVLSRLTVADLVRPTTPSLPKNELYEVTVRGRVPAELSITGAAATAVAAEEGGSPI
jgi:Rrf2 family transcriptional regulator, nitric oxide-sensitive transcriptional repressor